MAKTYINRTIIPALCRKAGVPTSDVRGKITSHRARSTIASQLYNAKEPMTLFELQAWLGHRTPAATQFYAKINPKTLAKAYTQAGYFARNLRTIEVLLDRDAVTTGAASHGSTMTSAMAGAATASLSSAHIAWPARAATSTSRKVHKSPTFRGKRKPATYARLHPADRGRRAAIEDGQSALDVLLDRLADTPSPAGPTPRQLGTRRSATLLPIVEVRHGEDPSCT